MVLYISLHEDMPKICFLQQILAISVTFRNIPLFHKSKAYNV